MSTLTAFSSPGDNPIQRFRSGSSSSASAVRLCGPIRDASTLPEVINMLSVSGWAGELEVRAPAATFRLGFAQGAVKSASSTLSAHRLGELLIGLGKVTKEDVRDCVLQLNEEMRIGEALVNRGSLTADQLFDALRYQAEQIFYTALTVPSGNFVFCDFDEQSEPPPVTFHLPIQHLLLEGVRRMDERRPDPGRLEREARHLLREFNQALRMIFHALPSEHAQETRERMRDFISASGLASYFGQRLQEDGTVDTTRVLRALAAFGEPKALQALYQGLHDLTTFTLFSVRPRLSHQAERALASRVVRLLMRIELPA